MRTRTGWLAASAATLALACAGAPKHKVDESVLQDIPPSQKQGMLNAQADIDRATAELKWAQTGLDTAKQDVQLAKTLRDQARLEVNKDQARLDQAERFKDADRINEARDRLGVSNLGVSGADARIAWLEQEQKAQQAQVNLATEQQRTARARYELEKARLAQQQHRQPSQNFQVSQFEQQLAAQQRQEQAAQGQLDEQREQANRLRDQYSQIAQQYNQERTRVPGSEPAFILPPPTQNQRAKAPGHSYM
jgi:hypothetical protein